MSQGKFKVGNRVVVSRNREGYTSFIGESGTVKSIAQADVSVELDVSGRRYFEDSELEFADLGPIRTVTRREIVPGVYGGVVVERNTITDSPRPFIKFHAHATAESLREAAHLFNQIAEILEEQQEAA